MGGRLAVESVAGLDWNTQGSAFFANLPAAKVGIEACASAHYWAREISRLGHEVRLIAGQRVSRRVVGNKNDYRDGKAICELRAEPETLYVQWNPQPTVAIS